MTAEIQDIATTVEKTQAATSNSSQEDQRNTISHWIYAQRAMPYTLRIHQ
jgi:hypothetical protein